FSRDWSSDVCSSDLGQLIIDSTGYIDGFVQCTVAGPIEASIDTITNILVALSGLDRATNTSAAIAGVNAESPENFEQRRQESVRSEERRVGKGGSAG